MKLMETSKLKEDKYCLAFHPSMIYKDLQEMGGVRLKELKDHVNSIGGCWGNDSWASLVRDDVDKDFDTTGTEVGQSGLDNTHSKKALIIPVSCFSSTQIIRLCDLLGQNEDYKRFGADEETPSGVEEFSSYRNSTQLPGSQGFRLQVSSIAAHVEEEEGIEFDNLTEPEDNEFIDQLDNEVESLDKSKSCEECDMDFNTIEEFRRHFIDEHEKEVSSNKSKRNQRYITEVSKNDTIYFVCNCGFSSVQKSAATRHKCRTGDDVLFHCPDCNKPCKNPGSLKRHQDSKYKRNGTLNVTSYQSLSMSTTTLGTSLVTDVSEHTSKFACHICKKVLLTDSNLKKHIDKVHSARRDIHPDAEEAEVAGNSSEVAEQIVVGNKSSCIICKKTLMNASNLKRHMEKVHSDIQGRADSSKVLSESGIRSLLGRTTEETRDQTAVSCSFRNDSFKTQTNLTNHVRQEHEGGTELSSQSTRLEESSFSCHICSKTLKTRTNLQKHVSKFHQVENASSARNEEPEAEETQGRRSTRSSQTAVRRRSISLLSHKGRRK